MATAEATKTKISAGELKAALKAVAPAVPGRTPKPILENVLLADGWMTATDLDLRIAVAVGYDGPPTLLPFDRAKAIADSLPDSTIVTLDVQGTAVLIAGGSGRWRLPVEDYQEFPGEDTKPLVPVARIPADQFYRAVKSTIFAIDTASARYALGAVLLDVTGDEINFVGTDGRRLCVVEAGVEQAVDDSQTLCPPAALNAAMSLSEKDQGAVQIEKTSSEVVLTSERWRVAGRMIDGKFPRWRDVLPDRDVKQTVVDRNEFRDAVNAARICVDEVSRGVTFRFGETVKLVASSSVVGEAKVSCPVVEAGEDVTVKLDPRYVLEWLKSLPGKDADPNVTIDAIDKASAVVFRCDDATNVVMPLEVGA